jgi:uncharacterized protein (TIGR00369 family)
MTDLLEIGRSVLARQPFSVLAGAQLVRFEPGRAELALEIRDQLKQQHGFVHGGVLCYLADNAITFAAGSLFGDGLTLELKTNYLRPAIGERLLARAEVAHAGKRYAVVRCELLTRSGEEERLCAIALGTVIRPDARSSDEPAPGAA